MHPVARPLDAPPSLLHQSSRRRWAKSADALLAERSSAVRQAAWHSAAQQFRLSMAWLDEVSANRSVVGAKGARRGDSRIWREEGQLLLGPDSARYDRVQVVFQVNSLLVAPRSFQSSRRSFQVSRRSGARGSVASEEGGLWCNTLLCMHIISYLLLLHCCTPPGGRQVVSESSRRSGPYLQVGLNLHREVA